MIKAILGLLVLFTTLSAWATTFRPGDVILQPMRCYLCRMIEEHEQSPFAHMGVVVEVNDTVWVAEALGVVRIVSLDEFIQKGDLTRAHVVIRPIEAGPFPLRAEIEPLLGAQYDHDFRWDNLGRDGREALYCSELVTKIMNPYLVQKIPTKIMDYTLNGEAWERYFRGNVPQGLPGNSPGDFGRSPLFKPIATYESQQWNWN